MLRPTQIDQFQFRLVNGMSGFIALGENVVGQQLFNQIDVRDQHATAAIAIQAQIVQRLAVGGENTEEK
jgi:hypothetical protein